VNTTDLAQLAVRAAARVRVDVAAGPATAICPYDVAEALGVPVRLVAAPSLEGMYSPEPTPTIIVNIKRPAGRRRFTCSHEVGHHIFKHGARLDQLDADAAQEWSPEEFIAQRFAAALLMPNLAIDSAFSLRKRSIADATPELMFTIAQELGVGYTTLVGHLENTLKKLTGAQANALRRVDLQELRPTIAGCPVEHDLVPVDQHWRRRTIDLEVGDIVSLPTGARFRGECAAPPEERRTLLLAQTQGTGELTLENCEYPIAVRVSRRDFTGIARYRHMEEPPDEH
jgi:IrrE N-terminal-like domain